MTIPFSKYHGTGNDFIIIDNRFIQWIPTVSQVSSLCNRHFGIGADGLMLLSEKEGFDFAMTYYNSDGNESTMCGNGGRCMTAFAKSLELINHKAHFRAVDGIHESEILDNESGPVCRLKMKDTRIDHIHEDGIFLDTGSPHFVQFVKYAATLDVFHAGRVLRYDARFLPGGTNVDFAEETEDGLFVRTFERGVEDETLSCGTGVTAAALAHAFLHPENPGFRQITTLGGLLKVSFEQNGMVFMNIWLEGPGTFVFKGEVEV
ncbi:MAG: diaminopimelate epimerase [Bacteroidales bacterium]